MKSIRFLLLVTAISLSLTLSSAQAALHDRGGGLIYDDVLNVIWLQDANYGAGSSYDDGFNYSDGSMSWQSALAWTGSLTYFDSVRGVTYDDWCLPSIKPINGSFYDYGYANNGTSDIGHNIASPVSELAYMYFVNLANLATYSTSGGRTSGLGANRRPNQYER